MNDFTEEPRVEEEPIVLRSNWRPGKWVAVGCAVIALATVFLALLVAILVATNPFGWHFMDLLFGDSTKAAAAMPAETVVYVGMDMLELTPEKLGRVVDPFLREAGAQDVDDFKDGLDKFDAEMLSEYGFNIQDDILPWLGRSAGFAITNLDMDQYGSPEGVDWVLAVTTRNEGRADEFLVKLRQVVSEQSGYDFATTVYDDVTIYELASTDTFERMAMGRMDGLVIFGAGAGAVEAAVEARQGESLADSQQFDTLVSELPKSSAMTIYVDPSSLGSLVDNLALGLNAGLMTDGPNAASAGSLCITDDGLQMDMVDLINRDELEPGQLAALEVSTIRPDTDQLFPDSTLVYMAGRRLDLFWESTKEAVTGSLTAEEVDEAMAMFAEEFGINPDTELFPLLDGDWALGLLPGATGFLSEELDVDMVVVLLAETSDRQALTASLNKVADALVQGNVPLDPERDGDMEAFTLRDFPGGPEMLSFGVMKEFMFISSGTETVQELFAGGAALADSGNYRLIWNSFPNGMTPAYYVDVTGIVETVRQGMDTSAAADFDEVARYFKPVTALAGATESGQDVSHSTTIVFITAVE